MKPKKNRVLRDRNGRVLGTAPPWKPNPSARTVETEHYTITHVEVGTNAPHNLKKKSKS